MGYQDLVGCWIDSVIGRIGSADRLEVDLTCDQSPEILPSYASTARGSRADADGPLCTSSRL